MTNDAFIDFLAGNRITCTARYSPIFQIAESGSHVGILEFLLLVEIKEIEGVLVKKPPAPSYKAVLVISFTSGKHWLLLARNLQQESRTPMQLPVPGSPPHHYYYSVSADSTASSSINNGGKSPRVDFQFPTSPQPADASGGGGVIIQHDSHPNHHLAQITVPADLFLCGGCREYGAGKRFVCQECDFQLHEFCALSPPELRGHPLHLQHQLVFHSRPKQAGISWPKCDVCGKSIKGFTFRCRACGFQMHPCCAMLSTEMTFPPTPPQGNGHQHSLKLLPTGYQPISIPTTITSTSNNNNNNNTMVGGGGQQQQAALCGECKRKRSGGRMYRCTDCNYHLHAVCAKAMINGLRANGMAAPEKPNKSMMLGTAARLASQVVIEFIGGLIEGFGEGVGQVLVQNITRRRRRLLLHQPTTPPT